jgi:diaminopimelate epimerase
MRFTKAHGTGNDFVVLLDLEDRLELPAALVTALCDRRHGIGGDGVLRLGSPPEGADVFMDYRNADGTAVEMCGNGVRVTAKHVVDHGIVPADADVVHVATRAGVKPVEVQRDGHGKLAVATVDMGPPVLDAARVPFVADAVDREEADHEVVVDDTPVRLTPVSMGNPHAVIEVGAVDVALVTTLGPRLEHHPRFPQKVNVGFAQVLRDDEIRLRVWERGVGETAACGTGACAAVVALQRRDRVGERVAVHLPGGTLTIEHEPGGTVLLTGPAIEVAHGELDEAWLTAASTKEGERP